MYQVTAIYQGSEIGFGLGDSYQYAIEECMESIDTMYTTSYDVVRFIDLHIVANDNAPKYVDLSQVFYRQRQYF